MDDFFVTPELQEFRDMYSERSPQRHSEPITLVKLEERHGVRLLQRAPASGVQFGMPPSAIGQGSKRYLWVIDRVGIPYIIEQPLSDIGNGLPKHTNLTGGEDAYLGGELWFTDNSSLFLSGGSGRYPPINLYQLSDAVRVFESYRYRVTSLGWNEETNEAARRYNGGELTGNA